jgi:DNA-binding LacI/PurR family transcriptional regulator
MDIGRKAGRKCPADLSIIAFGDSPKSAHWRPKLTTFALSPDRVAAGAIGVISQHRSQRRVQPKTILIPEELVVRESTGLVPEAQK